MSQETVLVTGASGYLGSWISKRFLHGGYRVLASVRDPENEEKCGHLCALAEDSPGELELFGADLLRPGDFDEACLRSDLVVHSATPFLVDPVEDPEAELLRPAVEGTRNVLSAATASGRVRRVVLTSSVVALHGDAKDVDATEAGFFHEGHWNSSSSLKHQPYNYAKRRGEEEAWRLAEQAPWRLLVINPGFILGPALSARADFTSAILLNRLIGGEFSSGVPALSYGVVDVREVATAHYEAAVRNGAEGRHIVVATTATFLELAQTVDRLFPGAHKVPQRELPKALLYLLAPKIGLSWKFISRNVGRPVRYDNRKSKRELGLFYRPLEETLRDHREQMIVDGLL